MTGKELRATYLMIGDWVLYKGELHQIVDIDRFSTMVESKTTIDSRADFDEIEPIPLTAEILEKNGWKCYNTYRQFSCNNVPFELRGLDDGGFTMQVAADEFGSGTFLFIQYIHQLQHALKLCGIDKNIVL